jgi:hypothetical protein
MIDNDRHLEQYLAEFQPRSVRKLDAYPQPAFIQLRRLAAVAIFTLSAGIGLWLAHRLPAPVPQVAVVQPQDSPALPPHRKLSTVALTKLALENSHEFDLYLLHESRNVLPGLKGENSTLHVLITE